MISNVARSYHNKMKNLSKNKKTTLNNITIKLLSTTTLSTHKGTPGLSRTPNSAWHWLRQPGKGASQFTGCEAKLGWWAWWAPECRQMALPSAEVGFPLQRHKTSVCSWSPVLLVCLYLLCKNSVQRRLFHTWVWIKCCFHCAFILYNIWVFPQVKSSDLCNRTSSITCLQMI